MVTGWLEPVNDLVADRHQFCASVLTGEFGFFGAVTAGQFGFLGLVLAGKPLFFNGAIDFKSVRTCCAAGGASRFLRILVAG